MKIKNWGRRSEIYSRKFLKQVDQLSPLRFNLIGNRKKLYLFNNILNSRLRKIWKSRNFVISQMKHRDTNKQSLMISKNYKKLMIAFLESRTRNMRKFRGLENRIIKAWTLAKLIVSLRSRLRIYSKKFRGLIKSTLIVRISLRITLSSNWPSSRT